MTDPEVPGPGAAGRRRSRRRSLLLALLASLGAWVGLAIGVGIGLPWLLDDGVSATAVAGCLALVLGVACLVAAGVWLWRGTRGWGRLALVPWLLAVLVGTYSLGIALAATTVAPTPVAATPPAALPNAHDVTMTSSDGTGLAGWYVPGSNGAAIVLRHGAGSNRSATVAQAAVLNRHGYGVLLTDARGHGRSEGRAMDLGWNGDADIAAALAFLAEQPGIDPDRLAVLGLSMGGEEAIGAAAADPRIRAVVAEGATNRTAEDKAWMSEEYGVAGQVQGWLDRLTYGLVGLLAAPPEPLTLRAAVEAADVPTLVIAAGSVDSESQVAERLAAASPDTVTTWVVPSGGHIAGLATAPEEWEQHVVSFLDEALG